MAELDLASLHIALVGTFASRPKPFEPISHLRRFFPGENKSVRWARPFATTGFRRTGASTLAPNAAV